MDRRKEIFDYLRNQQKQAEIESKVDGINIWVILGAISIVAWKLVSNDFRNILMDPATCTRFLLCAEFFYILINLSQYRDEETNVPRFVTLPRSGSQSPTLNLLDSILVLVPGILGLVYLSDAVAPFVIFAFGLILSVISGALVFVQFARKHEEIEIFPRPRFADGARGSLILIFSLSAAFLYSLIEQIFAILQSIKATPVAQMQALLLVAVLYVLIQILIKRKQMGRSIDWTYSAERDLLLQTITEQAVLRRIENRSLGTSLRGVMDRFFEEFDASFSKLNLSIKTARAALIEPESASLTDAASQFWCGEIASLKTQTNLLKVLSERFETYLKEIGRGQIENPKIEVKRMLPGLEASQRELASKVAVAHSEIEHIAELLTNFRKKTEGQKHTEDLD